MSYINEWLGKIIKKCGKDVGFELFKALCSASCAFITKSIGWTLFYILGTTLFDILNKIYEEVSLGRIVNKIFKMNNIVKYIIFIMEFLQKRLYNLVPNLFGALIVCSFIKYLSKFKAEEVLCAAINLKKELFDIIMRCGFMIALLNALNHAIRNEQRYTELCNVFHLYVIIFSGIIVLGAFGLWLSSTNEFDLSKTKVYPTFSLIWCLGFLFSCVYFPVVLRNENVE